LTIRKVVTKRMF